MFTLFFSNWCFSASLYEQAFEESKFFEFVVDLWNTVDAAWNDVFNWWTKLTENWLERVDPLIIRVTKLFLKITILLSIVMVIVTWIKFIIAMWEGWFQKNLKKLLPIVVWLLIALFSVVIIEILSSLPMSTLPN
jgi:hypothetical protein